MPRVQRRFLLRSRWTATRSLAGGEGECHFEVLDVQASEVTLRAVLTDRRYTVAIDAFADAAMWLLDWQSLPGP